MSSTRCIVRVGTTRVRFRRSFPKTMAALTGLKVFAANHSGAWIWRNHPL
ncbi:hypothetical protein OG394_39770 [Kribbella sp. NBC_01245]|nr:hypothetical protein [Kribbella sp. NBC_01245]